MTSGTPITPLDEQGFLSRRIFSDPVIFGEEMERLFPASWLFLGHESLIPDRGDYITTSMGADPVIVIRDDVGLRAFLNTCTHRGNRVCLFDSGNARTFTCSYHGWSFGTDGRLKGVPFVTEAYYDDIDKKSLGLMEVPRVESFGGLVFGSWNRSGPGLRDYLGEMSFYLDHFLDVADYGGLEPMGERSGYALKANWKIIAENNSGDHYHTLTTHGSTYRLGLRSKKQGFEGEQSPYGPFEIGFENGHCIGGVETDVEYVERELEQAKSLGPAAVEWVRERQARFLERCKDLDSRPYSFSHGNVFPNFSFFGRGGALNGRLLSVIHPREPSMSEVWHWFFVEGDAPEVVKESAWARLGQEGQLASGMFAQDDAENFERVTESTTSPMARRLPFHLGMGVGVEGNWPGQDQWDTRGLPGLIGPRFSEHNQRIFYRAWAESMNRSSQEADL